jgi:hypothetical protein
METCCSDHCGVAVQLLVAASNAQEKSTNEASAVSAKDLTREQFGRYARRRDQINGERIAKGAFQARNVSSRGSQQLQDSAPHLSAAQGARYERRRWRSPTRKSRPRSPSSSMMRLSTDPLARKKQAADLFEKAAKATPTERSSLRKPPICSRTPK